MLEKKQKYYLLKITSILNATIFLGLLLTVAIINTTSLNQIFNINPSSDWKFYSLKIFLILILTIVLLASILWLTISFKNNWIVAIKDNHFISFLLATLTLNFYGCFFITKMIHSNKDIYFNRNNFWLNFKTKLGIKQWLTIDYVLIGFFCALTLVFAYIEENLLPRMPFGGGIAIKYIPLIIISFSTSFAAGWLTGFVTALMSLLFIPAGNIISPWSYALDYFLPMTTPAMIAFLPNKIKSEKTIFTYINYFIHCFFVLLIIYFWQVIGGYVFWTKAAPIWDGYSALLYSFVYNFIHIFIFTYPICQMIIPVLYRSLGSYFLNRYH